MCFPASIATSSALIDLGRPTNSGITMWGNTTTSRNGSNGSAVMSLDGRRSVGIRVSVNDRLMKMGPPRVAVKPKRRLMQKDRYVRRFNDTHRKAPVRWTSLEDVQNACLNHVNPFSTTRKMAISDLGTAIG